MPAGTGHLYSLFKLITMFKGHPKGLIIASLANMGERFGFYTMYAIFTLVPAG